MDKRTKTLLIALCLGDGHLSTNSGISLCIEHCRKQRDYLTYKRELVAELLNCSLPTEYYRKDRDTFRMMKGHKYFKSIYNLLYTNKVKRFSKKLLEYLTPEALAIWFMDDGTRTKERSKVSGCVRSQKMVLCTFTNEEDTQNIIDYLKEKYDIKMYPIWRKMKDGSTKAYLQCRTREARKLSALIRPYIIPSMQYKVMQPDE